MDPKSRPVDNRVGPGARDQLILVDRLAGGASNKMSNARLPMCSGFPSSSSIRCAGIAGEGFFIHP